MTAQELIEILKKLPGDVEVQGVDAAKLKAEVKRTGFERNLSKCYNIDIRVLSRSSLSSKVITEKPFGYFLFNDQKLCNDYARAINLFLNLSRWQALNDKPVKRGNMCGEIRYYYDNSGLMASTSYGDFLNSICFSTTEAAEKAIEEFREELQWYFT